MACVFLDANTATNLAERWNNAFDHYRATLVEAIEIAFTP
jgi:hypothetical protein